MICYCVICNKEMNMKPSRLKRVKHGITCSVECERKNRSKWFLGENNYQFGIKGDKNSSWKGGIHITNYGYVKIYKPKHPFKDCKGYVFEHRLVIEQNYKCFDKSYFIKINDNYYLNPKYEVHHKNEIKNDNRLEKLIVYTKSQHKTIHNLMNPRNKNKENGRFEKNA